MFLKEPEPGASAFILSFIALKHSIPGGHGRALFREHALPRAAYGTPASPVAAGTTHNIACGDLARSLRTFLPCPWWTAPHKTVHPSDRPSVAAPRPRSEERRVEKECRSRW